LVELYHRPAVVMAEIDRDHFTASARSIPEFNMVEAFTACQDLFVRFGGHSQAAGFTLRKDKISLLADRLTGIADERLSHCELQPTLQIDAELSLADITAELQGWLRQLGPFGPGNPHPKFLSRNVPVSEVQFVGQQGQHARLRLKEGTREWTALAFHQAERWSDYSPRIDLVYTITSDSWNGTERVTLKVLDARPSVV
jgi:single-stranded-DNA-specific exonuclease